MGVATRSRGFHDPRRVTFRDWQSLDPADAARELHRRVHRALSPAQQRAAIAFLKPEPQLAEAFARADRSAPLGGVPYFLKDLFDIAGLPTRAGSTFFDEVRPAPATSRIVRTLDRAGAVFAGKTHLHEFAYGITGENPHYGDCEHPRFADRTSGGSSSGSASVVAAGIAPLAIGTDTGGSIRVPAAFCGLHGFRLAPRDPLIADAVPLAPSFDTAGWFTSNAADMLAMISTVVTPANVSTPPPRGCYLEPPGLEPEVALACRQASARFAPVADDLTRRDLVHGFTPALDAYSRIVAAEAWAYHAPWFERWHSRYDPAVTQRLETGRGLPPATLEEARAAVAAIQSLWAAFFARFDFLALPATPFAALSKADCTLENRRRLLALTTPASLAGLPALTIPLPLPSGPTAGLQLIAREPTSAVFSWALMH